LVARRAEQLGANTNADRHFDVAPGNNGVVTVVRGLVGFLGVGVVALVLGRWRVQVAERRIPADHNEVQELRRAQEITVRVVAVGLVLGLAALVVSLTLATLR
jgi:hypothetical protein